jgi:two-component system, cell cycle response regulator DivK
MSVILVIEDAQSNARLVQVALETSGYEVHCAFTGLEALEMAGTLRPALIIIDLRLPGSSLDGWEVIKRIREDPELRATPIIVTAVEVFPEDRTRAFDAGCDAYFTKPFKIQTLRAEIAEYIGPPSKSAR